MSVVVVEVDAELIFSVGLAKGLRADEIM